jgi:long-chain acyl-CoA synthetase
MHHRIMHSVCNVQVRLRDVPEMNYFATDNPPRGEVCCRGSNVFPGYWKDDVATAAAFDKGVVDPEFGWLCTGDIARLNANGNLTIIDRRKHIFKLSQGEYVAPEKVELAYSKCDGKRCFEVFHLTFDVFELLVSACARTLR